MWTDDRDSRHSDCSFIRWTCAYHWCISWWYVGYFLQRFLYDYSEYKTKLTVLFVFRPPKFWPRLDLDEQFCSPGESETPNIILSNYRRHIRFWVISHFFMHCRRDPFCRFLLPHDCLKAVLLLSSWFYSFHVLVIECFIAPTLPNFVNSCVYCPTLS